MFTALIHSGVNLFVQWLSGLCVFLFLFPAPNSGLIYIVQWLSGLCVFLFPVAGPKLRANLYCSVVEWTVCVPVPGGRPQTQGQSPPLPSGTFSTV